jgi:3-phenylpropionate/cinnamic acid dioxygenase small subunit
MPEAEREIENLISRYAFLVDDGDFGALGTLLDHAEFRLGTARVRGRTEIERLARTALRIYADGTPRTRHVTTNLIIEVDEAAGLGSSRSYFTVLQATDGFPLQVIASGRYSDRFERHDGAWRFAYREVSTDLVGDVSHHRAPS